MSKECKKARNIVLGVWVILMTVMLTCSSCGTYTSCVGVDGGQKSQYRCSR